MQSDSERDDLLASFKGVYIQDSSQIELPACLHPIWQGNQTEQATLKVQAVMDYQHGLFDLTLASGRDHDCPLQTVALPTGSLRLADLGYFNVKVFEQLTQQGVWWVSRLPARVGIWQDGHVMHLADWLNQHDSACIDQPVELTAHRLPCRLMAVRVPPEVAAERRKRVRKAASKRKSNLKPETLDLCAWTILITNLPPETFSAEDVLRLQRLRWQIELLFKLWIDKFNKRRWKSGLSLDEWRSHQPHQILSEVYAKLLLALVQHWLLLLGCWQQEKRSLVKAAQTLRKHAFHILSALPHLTHLLRALRLILPTLARCTVQKRKARPATFQLLARASP